MTKWEWRLIFLSLLVPHIYLKSQKLILSIGISIENWNIFGINKLILNKISVLIPFCLFFNQYVFGIFWETNYFTTTVHYLQPNIMWQTGNPISKKPMWKLNVVDLLKSWWRGGTNAWIECNLKCKKVDFQMRAAYKT